MKLNEKIKIVFPEIREAFGLEREAGVGREGYWHEGVANGIVLPMIAVSRKGKTEWQTPYQITEDGRIYKYSKAEKDEIILPPESNCSKKAYLISISPAPGLKSAFESISYRELTGLLAHELAEITIAKRELKQFHSRIIHHKKPESYVDRLASQFGYKYEVKEYLTFLNNHIRNLKPRPPRESSLDSLLSLLGSAVTVIDIGPKVSAKGAKAEILQRLEKL